MRNTSSRPARLLDAETVANVGLFRVGFRLSRDGRTGSPATRHARGLGLVACRRDAARTRLGVGAALPGAPAPGRSRTARR